MNGAIVEQMPADLEGGRRPTGESAGREAVELVEPPCIQNNLPEESSEGFLFLRIRSVDIKYYIHWYATQPVGDVRGYHKPSLSTPQKKSTKNINTTVFRQGPKFLIS